MRCPRALREAQSCPLKQLVDKLIPESIGKEVEKACSGIYPLQNVFVRKVKMLKKPKFDLTQAAGGARRFGQGGHRREGGGRGRLQGGGRRPHLVSNFVCVF